jgi:hypothetical protein
MVYSLILADIIMVAATLLSYSQLPPQIPLYYTHPWGEDQLADMWVIALIPLLLHIFFFVNNWIKNKYVVKESFVAKLINVFNLFLVCTFTLVFLKIILLVI